MAKKNDKRKKTKPWKSKLKMEKRRTRQQIIELIQDKCHGVRWDDDKVEVSINHADGDKGAYVRVGEQGFYIKCVDLEDDE